MKNMKCLITRRLLGAFFIEVISLDNCIMYRHEFVVIKVDVGFIVYNTNKIFKLGHTHLKNFNACISAIKLVEQQEMPKNKSKYFINSLIRISQNEEYIERLNEINVDFESMMKDSKEIDNKRCL